MGQWYLQAIVICYSLSTFCSYTTVTYLSENIPKPLNPSNDSSNMLDDSRERGIGRSLNLVDLVLGVGPRGTHNYLDKYHRLRDHIASRYNKLLLLWTSPHAKSYINDMK